jgi:hypothetical protein
MTETLDPPLFVLAQRHLDAYDWCEREGIPRNRVRPLACQKDMRSLVGASTVTLYRHETWAFVDMAVTHEVLHRLAGVRATYGEDTVTEIGPENPELLDPWRTGPTAPPAPPVPAMSEDDLKATVIQMARDNGWLVCHFRPAKTEKGWRTPIEGDKGLPDLVLARRGVVLLAELKSGTGRLSNDQKKWLDHLGAMGCVWRPADLPEIEKALT